jgi:hypothetical protein
MVLTEIECEGVCWIHLAQDEIRWRFLVHIVIVIRVKYKAAHFIY